MIVRSLRNLLVLTAVGGPVLLGPSAVVELVVRNSAGFTGDGQVLPRGKMPKGWIGVFGDSYSDGTGAEHYLPQTAGWLPGTNQYYVSTDSATALLAKELGLPWESVGGQGQGPGSMTDSHPGAPSQIDKMKALVSRHGRPLFTAGSIGGNSSLVSDATDEFVNCVTGLGLWSCRPDVDVTDEVIRELADLIFPALVGMCKATRAPVYLMGYPDVFGPNPTSGQPPVWTQANCLAFRRYATSLNKACEEAVKVANFQLGAPAVVFVDMWESLKGTPDNPHYVFTKNSHVIDATPWYGYSHFVGAIGGGNFFPLHLTAAGQQDEMPILDLAVTQNQQSAEKAVASIARNKGFDPARTSADGSLS